MDREAPLTVPDAAEPERPRWTSVRFTGDRRTFRGMLYKEVLLVAATLGIYWFWARTRVRRYVWSHTQINGTPLEYSGKGLELFLGFVIAGALFALTYWLLQLAVASAGFGPIESISISIGVYGLFFAMVYALAAYRTRRYLVRRTSWRGIRCGLDGSSPGFVRHAIVPAIATALTLGLAFPWLTVAVQRYLIGNMSLGSARFRYEGRGRDLFWKWFFVWLLILPSFGYSLFWWRGRVTQYHYSAVRLERMALESRMDPWRVFGICFGGGILMALVFYIPAGVITQGVTTLFSAAQPGPVMIGLSAAASFSIFFALSWGLYLYLVEYKVLEHGLKNLLISGSMDWGDIEQIHPQAGGPGDGLDAVLGLDGI